MVVVWSVLGMIRYNTIKTIPTKSMARGSKVNRVCEPPEGREWTGTGLSRSERRQIFGQKKVTEAHPDPMK